MTFDITAVLFEAEKYDKAEKKKRESKGPKIPLTVRPELFSYDPVNRGDSEMPPSYQIEKAILAMKVGQVYLITLGEYTRDIGLALENIKNFSRKAWEFDLRVVTTSTGKSLKVTRKVG